MPSFSLPLEKQADGSLRPVVPVGIADASKVKPARTNGQSQKIDLSAQVVRGLIDTGAQATCITADLARRMKIKPIKDGERNTYRLAVIVMAQGKMANPQAEVQATPKPQNVMLPISTPNIITAGEFANAPSNDIEGGDVEVRIGMDVIKSAVLVIAGHDQRLTMSF